MAWGRETGKVDLVREGRLALAKHEGAGNDFLVLVDPDGRFGLGATEARALCDRHRGVGADGLIVVGAGRAGAALSMELFNADGSPAEMSGNGLRCLAQAAVLAGLVEAPRFDVATAAGVRTVDYEAGPRREEASVRVDMGPVKLGEEEDPPPPASRARLADVGNPHLVLLVADPAAVDVPALGPAIEAGYPGGINVSFVAAVDPGELVLRVWERGAGETLACGTGNCAAAAVARSWGLVGDDVAVTNPGGQLHVALGPGDGDPVVLTGPVRKVADVTVDLDTLR